MRCAARLEFQCTNNTAEYKAVLLGLHKAIAMGIQRLIIKIDSQVVAGHRKTLQSKRPRIGKIPAISKRPRKILRRLHSQKHFKNR